MKQVVFCIISTRRWVPEQLVVRVVEQRQRHQLLQCQQQRESQQQHGRQHVDWVPPLIPSGVRLAIRQDEHGQTEYAQRRGKQSHDRKEKTAERVMPLNFHNDADGRTLLAWTESRLLCFHVRTAKRIEPRGRRIPDVVVFSEDK